MQLSQVGKENVHHPMLAYHKEKRNGPSFLAGNLRMSHILAESLTEGTAQSLLDAQKRWASLPDTQ